MLCNTNWIYHFWRYFFNLNAVLIFNTKKDLDAHLSGLRKGGKRIGLVPTMGALHQGHLSLLNFIKEYSDVQVCSIFVNPTQFNNLEDLKKYPRPKDADIEKLKQAECDVLFMPSVDEMYAEGEEWHIDLEKLDSILEGAFREGHYQGVTQIVKKLFDIIKPDVAGFGQKDYQQYLVIKKMIEMLHIPVELKLCSTVREEDGLAMSSRNIRLSAIGRQQALSIYRSLAYLRENITSRTIQEVKRNAFQMLKESEGLELEYFEICNPNNLEPVVACEVNSTVIALVAAWVDGVRLIDNMLIEINK